MLMLKFWETYSKVVTGHKTIMIMMNRTALSPLLHSSPPFPLPPTFLPSLPLPPPLSPPRIVYAVDVCCVASGGQRYQQEEKLADHFIYKCNCT